MFLRELIDRYYLAICRSLGLYHRIYSLGSWMNEVIESVIVKDMTRIFDNYFPCRKKGCMLEHVWSWMKMRIMNWQLKP